MLTVEGILASRASQVFGELCLQRKWSICAGIAGLGACAFRGHPVAIDWIESRPAASSQTVPATGNPPMFLPIGDNIERRSFPIAPCILIALNTLVFSYQWQLIVRCQGVPQLIDQALENHFDTWGLTPTCLADGQVIGLITHMFLHADLGHLLGNMFVLWAFSCSLEAALGFSTYLGFYLLWGILSGLAQTAMSWGSDIPLIGASGAISGVMGAYMVLYGYDSQITCLIWFAFRPFRFRIPAIVFGLGWLFLQLWSAAEDSAGMAGVAWYAHLGGFFAGSLTMWLFRHETQQKLVRDTTGVLSLQKKPTEAESENPEPAVATRAAVKPYEPWQPPQASQLLADHCPYCNTELNETHIFSPGLRRCPKCERLVYDELSVARA